jgi:uncharacterized delta-60 repeat protein
MKKCGRLLVESLLVASILTAVGPANGSTAGALDTTFGNGGIVRTTFTNIGAGAVLFQSSGDIVTVGSVTGGLGAVRFLPNGQLDSSFGTQGVATINMADSPTTSVAFVSAALQSDNKILALAHLQEQINSSYVDIIGVARFNANGTPDTTFGQGGTFTFTPPAGSEFTSVTPTAMLVQSDGKIVVAGSVPCGTGCSPFTEFLRLNPNGTLDDTFGQDGSEVMRVYGGSPDILAELTTGDLLTYSRNVVAQYSPSGALRPQVTGGTRLATSTKIYSGDVIQPDGKVLTAATVSGRSYQNLMWELTRFLPTSGVDWAFENPPFQTEFFDAAVEPDDGKIVVAAPAPPAFTGTNILRFNPDGSVDTTFGNGGKVLLSIPGGTTLAVLVTIQPDGKILVAGSFQPSGSPPYSAVMVLARYLHLAH